MFFLQCNKLSTEKQKTKKKDDMVQVEVVRLLLNEVINFPLHSLFMKELKTNSLLIAINYNSYTGRKHKVKAKGGDAILF